MAARRSRRNIIQDTMDLSNPSNWTSTQLKEALKELGINISGHLSHAVLKRLYLDNVKSSASDGNRTGTDAEDMDDETRITATGNSAETSLQNSISRNVADSHVPLRNLVNDSPRMNTSTSAHEDCATSAQPSKLEQLMTQTLEMCQQTFRRFPQQPTSDQTFNVQTFNLQSAMSALPSALTAPPTAYYGSPMMTSGIVNSELETVPLFRAQHHGFGIPASAVSATDMVSPEIRRNITAEYPIMKCK